MKGYTSIKQYIDDYKLLRIAKKVDPGRDDYGLTVTKLIKKRIDERFENSSKPFKAMLKNNGYTKKDLDLIATHDSFIKIYELELFIRESFGVGYVNETHYKKLFSSNAFKNGRLKKLNDVIPLKIENKQDVYYFIKRSNQLAKKEIYTILSLVCKADWKKWINELIDAGRINEVRGRFI